MTVTMEIRDEPVRLRKVLSFPWWLHWGKKKKTFLSGLEGCEKVTIETREKYFQSACEGDERTQADT